MKTIFKTLALGLLLMTVASCEKHDFFDENTITGAVGPEAYWYEVGEMAKAGESVEFKAQYYSSVDSNYIDHTEVWYDLFEQEEKLITASLIKAFTYSYTTSTTVQARALQTIKSYAHTNDLWSDSLHAFLLVDKFPISNTLAPVVWANPQPSDTTVEKNLHTYFGKNFAEEFMAGVTAKMNPSEDERNYAAYMQVFQGLSLLTDTIETLNGDRMPYIAWMTDSAYIENSASWNHNFKQYDTIWSKINFDTLEMVVDSHEVRVNLGGRPPKFDTIMVYDTTYITKPLMDKLVYVYPQIQHAIDSVWENHVTFYDLITGADGYSIEYKRSYYINAELRVYDKKNFDPNIHTEGSYTGGTYSATDAKKITIN